MPWFGNPTFRIRHDPAEARRLLAEAGFSRASPLRTRFIVPSGQILCMPMNEHIRSAWREVGIQVMEPEVLYTAWYPRALGEISRAGNITANNVAYLTSDPLYAFIRFSHRAQIAPRAAMMAITAMRRWTAC